MPFPWAQSRGLSAPGKGFDSIMSTLGKCFNKTYLPDLILRHVSSSKSQPIKAANRTFLNHLNTLHLNRRPRNYKGEPRKSPISLRDERVLVVAGTGRGTSLDAQFVGLSLLLRLGPVRHERTGHDEQQPFQRMMHAI